MSEAEMTGNDYRTVAKNWVTIMREFPENYRMYRGLIEQTLAGGGLTLADIGESEESLTKIHREYLVGSAKSWVALMMRAPTDYGTYAPHLQEDLKQGGLVPADIGESDESLAALKRQYHVATARKCFALLQQLDPSAHRYLTLAMNDGQIAPEEIGTTAEEIAALKIEAENAEHCNEVGLELLELFRCPFMFEPLVPSILGQAQACNDVLVELRSIKGELIALIDRGCAILTDEQQVRELVLPALRGVGVLKLTACPLPDDDPEATVARIVRLAKDVAIPAAARLKEEISHL